MACINRALFKSEALLWRLLMAGYLKSTWFNHFISSLTFILSYHFLIIINNTSKWKKKNDCISKFLYNYSHTKTLEKAATSGFFSLFKSVKEVHIQTTMWATRLFGLNWPTNHNQYPFSALRLSFFILWGRNWLCEQLAEEKGLLIWSHN